MAGAGVEPVTRREPVDWAFVLACGAVLLVALGAAVFWAATQAEAPNLEAGVANVVVGFAGASLMGFGGLLGFVSLLLLLRWFEPSTVAWAALGLAAAAIFPASFWLMQGAASLDKGAWVVLALALLLAVLVLRSRARAARSPAETAMNP